MYEVTAICAAKGVTYGYPGHPKKKLTLEWEGGDESETGGMTNPNVVAHRMSPTEKANFPCALLNLTIPGDWIESAHILLIIKYHAPLLPFIPRYHRQRFELVKDSAGQFRWLEEPH
jgi:hypothetical protein